MKKLNTKVVIATTASLATMVLAAACGYGPPPDVAVPDSNYGVTTENNSEDDKANDASSILDSIDDELNNTDPDDDTHIDMPTGYGPPPLGF